MASTDRAFRALGRTEPEVLVELLRVLSPEDVAGTVDTDLTHAEPTQLDTLAAPEDADWIATVGQKTVLHMECQGYRDTEFSERLFWYHLQLAVRFRRKQVKTLALWTTTPNKEQLSSQITHRDITIQVRSLVLARVSAAVLLENHRTACFAPGAEKGSWSDEELCARVARSLAKYNASFYQRHMAVVTALHRGRYEVMIRSMSNAGVEPVIIEDFVKFGEDRGMEKGLKQGLRTSILDLCEAYGIAPTELQLNALQSMELSELEALRIAIKTKRAWG